jgi:feruloyl esterase
VATSDASGITLEAWFPSNWTGRFLATGNGGIGGCIQYEDVAYGNFFGFATVASNNGHDGMTGKPFLNAPNVIEDFAWRAVYTETIVGKELTNQFYNKHFTKAYYLGCSTGGRQGMKMAQAYPDLFSGIVAGAPAWDFNNLDSWGGYLGMQTGFDNTSSSFVPVNLWAVVHEEILKQCDGLDGAIDGYARTVPPKFEANHFC